MSARQVVRSSKGFKGRVLAFQSESSAFFYLCCLPRASGPPDGGQEKEKKNPKLGDLCTSAPPAAAKFWTSPRLEVEEKNPKLGTLCTSVPPAAAAKFSQVQDLD